MDFSIVGCSRKEYVKFGTGKMVSPTCFEEFVIGTQAWLLYPFVFLIFLQLVVQEKELVKQNMGKKMMDKVVENLIRGR